MGRKKSKKNKEWTVYLQHEMSMDDLIETFIEHNGGNQAIEFIKRMELALQDVEAAETLASHFLDIVIKEYKEDGTFDPNDMLKKSSDFVILRKDDLAAMASIVNTTSRMISGPVDLPEAQKARAVVSDMKAKLSKRLFNEIFIKLAKKHNAK